MKQGISVASASARVLGTWLGANLLCLFLVMSFAFFAVWIPGALLIGAVCTLGVQLLLMANCATRLAGRCPHVLLLSLVSILPNLLSWVGLVVLPDAFRVWYPFGNAAWYYPIRWVCANGAPFLSLWQLGVLLSFSLIPFLTFWLAGARARRNPL